MLEAEADDFLNQVSLDFLINKKQYKNHSISFTENTINKKINKKDKKFYRRRILSLTKDLLSKERQDSASAESESEIPPDIKYMFDNFIKGNFVVVFELFSELKSLKFSTNTPVFNNASPLSLVIVAFKFCIIKFT